MAALLSALFIHIVTDVLSCCASLAKPKPCSGWTALRLASGGLLGNPKRVSSESTWYLRGNLVCFARV